MITTTDINQTMAAEFTAGVKAGIARNNSQNWAQQDSAAALLCLAKGLHDIYASVEADRQDQPDDVSRAKEDGRLEGLFSHADEQFSFYANRLANPSAFAQWLEDGKHFADGKPRIVRSKKGGRAPSTDALAALL